VVLRVVVFGVVLVVSCVVVSWFCSCRVVWCVVFVVCLCVRPLFPFTGTHQASSIPGVRERPRCKSPVAAHSLAFLYSKQSALFYCESGLVPYACVLVFP